MTTRRRGEALEAAILDAAWDELDRGWPAFSVERVAERAGTGKAVLYRRWPNREALARAAVVRQAGYVGDLLPPTGDLRADLLAFALTVAAAYDGPLGQAVRGIIAAAQPGTEPGDGGIELPTGRIVTDFLAAAGLEPDGDSPRTTLVLNLGVSLVSHQTLVTGAGPDAATVATIVDEVWLPALREVVREI